MRNAIIVSWPAGLMRNVRMRNLRGMRCASRKLNRLSSSRVPRPFFAGEEKTGKNGLVYTVRACANYSVKSP